jgi:hypothetical protein
MAQAAVLSSSHAKTSLSRNRRCRPIFRAGGPSCLQRQVGIVYTGTDRYSATSFTVHNGSFLWHMAFVLSRVWASCCCAILGVLAGSGGGRCGEGGFAVVGPAGAGVDPGPDDAGGLVVVGEELGFDCAQVEWYAGVGGLGEPDLGALARSAQLADPRRRAPPSTNS